MKIKFLYLVLATLAIGATISCDNDDIDIFDSPANDIGAGTLVNTDKSISSLTFNWQAVDKVHQYGYTLTNAKGATVRQGITKDTSITFINLELDSKYDFTVEAYGANNSPTLVMHTSATTLAIQKLDTPNVSETTVDVSDKGEVTITWPAVENADHYDYALTNTNSGKQLAQGSIDTNELVFKSMAYASYSLELIARSDNPGYSDSDAAIFNFERVLREVGRYNCAYTSYALGSWQAEIVKYEDGSYEIPAFYGVEGYSLKFTIGSGTITLINFTSENGIYKDVPTGLAEHPFLTITMNKANCIYSPNTSEGKRVKMQAKLAGFDNKGQDIFTWREE